MANDEFEKDQLVTVGFGNNKQNAKVYELSKNPDLIKVEMEEGPFTGTVMLAVKKQVRPR